MRMEGQVTLFYSRGLQVSFWNMKEITGRFVCIVLLFFKIERNNDSEERTYFSIFIILNVWD